MSSIAVSFLVVVSAGLELEGRAAPPGVAGVFLLGQFAQGDGVEGLVPAGSYGCPVVGPIRGGFACGRMRQACGGADGDVARSVLGVMQEAAPVSGAGDRAGVAADRDAQAVVDRDPRSEEHTSELQSRGQL